MRLLPFIEAVRGVNQFSARNPANMMRVCVEGVVCVLLWYREIMSLAERPGLRELGRHQSPRVCTA